jgi:hypothetical protein
MVNSVLPLPESSRTPRFPSNCMRGFSVLGFLLLIGLSSSACIVRPGMNADCAWPPEAPRRLDLTNDADRRHLVVDTELIEDLVDRYRVHGPAEQPACERRLIDAVARTHSVGISDVARARDRIPEKGLDLPVSVPVTVFFVLTVLGVTRRVERRFSDETLPTIITLVIASVALAGLFVMVGEFWTSILQMIRVWNQHVGGRVAKSPWKQHEPQILVVGIVLFWTVLLLRQPLSFLRLRLRHLSFN